MGRGIRVEYRGAVYHVTSRGNERKAIFRGDEDRRKFLSILEEYHERYGVVFHAYALMGNHYHLIMETPRGNLVRVMHALNSAYTGYFNRKYRRSGHLFQGRYRALVVEKESYLAELSRYVHLNPVRAGLVEHPRDYTWSSYRGYCAKRSAVPWVEYAWILAGYGRGERAQRLGYQRFVEAGLKGKTFDPFKRAWAGVVLGSDDFIARIKERLRGTEIPEDIVERTRYWEYPSPERAVALVTDEFGVDEEIVKLPGIRGNVPGKVCLYLVQKYCGLGNREVGQFFGGMRAMAVSQAVGRFARSLKEDGAVRQRVKALAATLKSEA